MAVLTRPVLEINLPALLDNYQSLKKLAPSTICSAVVKDDAYGLGAKEVSSLQRLRPSQRSSTCHTDTQSFDGNSHDNQNPRAAFGY